MKLRGGEFSIGDVIALAGVLLTLLGIMCGLFLPEVRHLLGLVDKPPIEKHETQNAQPSSNFPTEDKPTKPQHNEVPSENKNSDKRPSSDSERDTRLTPTQPITAPAQPIPTATTNANPGTAQAAPTPIPVPSISTPTAVAPPAETFFRGDLPPEIPVRLKPLSDIAQDGWNRTISNPYLQDHRASYKAEAVSESGWFGRGISNKSGAAAAEQAVNECKSTVLKKGNTDPETCAVIMVDYDKVGNW